MIRVMLVDDQELVRAGLRGILRARFGFEIVAECGDGREALAAMRRSTPDVVLMDVRMPIVDGVAATSSYTPNSRRPRFSRSQPSTTTKRSPECCGPEPPASYSKECRPRNCSAPCASSPKAEHGSTPPSLGESSTFTAPRLPMASADHGAALHRLTDREREVLALIGEGHTNAEIARELFVGEGTVKTHINHLFSKLDLRDRAAAVIFAYEHHLVGDGPDHM